MTGIMWLIVTSTCHSTIGASAVRPNDLSPNYFLFAFHLCSALRGSESVDSFFQYFSCTVPSFFAFAIVFCSALRGRCVPLASTLPAHKFQHCKFETTTPRQTKMNLFAFVALLLSFAPYVFGSEDDTENNYKKHWAAHGICASIAWAILVPLAICSSMLRKGLVKAGFSDGFWFQLHRALNLTAASLTIIAFALAVFIIRAQDGSAHLKEDPHFLVGTVIFVTAMLQVTFALLRPSLPHHHTEEKKESVKNVDEEDTVTYPTEAKDVENKAESTDKESKANGTIGEKSEESTEKESEETFLSADGEKKSLLRLGWEVNHRFFGVGLLAMAWWQIHSGWELYKEEDFGGQDNGAYFLGVAGGIMGIAVIGKVVLMKHARA
jgi:hypothetical protein